MALGGQMHHRIRLKVGENPLQGLAIADIRPVEPIARLHLDPGQGSRIGGIGQSIQIGHFRCGLGEQPVHQRRADETGPPGDQDALRPLVRHQPPHSSGHSARQSASALVRV